MTFLQLKYSGSLPAFVGCQKDSGSTREKWTQVKPVLLTVNIFAVQDAESEGMELSRFLGLLGRRYYMQD